MATKGTAHLVPSAATPAMLQAIDSQAYVAAQAKPFASNQGFNLLGVPINLYNLHQSTSLVAGWAHEKTQTRLVTFTNVHMLTESHYKLGFLNQLRQMDLNCPDGMPLVWIGRLARQNVTRVCGPEFFEEFFASTAHEGLRHFFCGGKEGVAEKVAAELTLRYPDLQVAGVATPPFHSPTLEEDASIVERINHSGADIVWVSLGCPKQEIWMHEHRSRLKPCVVLAVGQAFDILVGETKRAPQFLCKVGFEWFYRLIKEPRRLGTRYLKSNLTFLYLLLASSAKTSFTIREHRRNDKAPDLGSSSTNCSTQSIKTLFEEPLS